MSITTKKALAELQASETIVLQNHDFKKQFFTKNELIQLLEITPSILKAWQKNGIIPYITIGEKGNARDFFRCSDINRILKIESN